MGTIGARENREWGERESGEGVREREGCQRQERETTRGGGLGGDRYVDRDRDRETEIEIETETEIVYPSTIPFIYIFI